MIPENYIPYIDETSKIQNIEVDINNIRIREQAISDLQINYSKNCVGKVTFLDYENLIEIMPLTYSVIRIQFRDLVGMDYMGSFIITKAEVNRYKDGSIKVTAYFENITSYNLKKTYISKTFKDKTLLEMLQVIFDEFSIPSFLGGSEYDYKHEYFVFPKNISLWEFLVKYLPKEGYTMFHDRIGLKILSRYILEASNIERDVPEYNFKYDSAKPHFNILEYQGVISNPGRLNEVAVLNKNYKKDELLYEFNFLGIADTLEKENSNGGYAGMSSEVKLSDFYPTIGLKEYDTLESFTIQGTNEDYRDIVRDNSKINIVIQGINTENLYHRIKVNIGKSKSIKTDTQDQVYTGEYIVTEVIDKIISGVFVQVLVLQSADYPKGDENVW